MGSERVRYDWVINIIMFYLLSPFLTLPVTSRQELFQIFDWIEELKKSGTDCSLFPFLSRSILGFSLSCWKRLATLGSLEFWLPAGQNWTTGQGWRVRRGRDQGICSVCSTRLARYWQWHIPLHRTTAPAGVVPLQGYCSYWVFCLHSLSLSLQAKE